MIPATDYFRFEPDDPFIRSKEFADLENSFYAQLKTSSGAWKTTFRNRLGAVNDALFSLLQAEKISPGIVMDVGISSGISTLEWLEQFRVRGHAIELIATDLTMTVYTARLAPRISVLFEPNGHVLQVECFHRGYMTVCGRRDWLSGMWVVKKLFPLLARLRLSWQGVTFPLDGHQPVPRGSSLKGPFHLVTPALRGNPSVTLLDDDILAPNRPELVGKADVVRLANILQHGYFPPEAIKTVVKNIGERCRGENSLVIVCRNIDDRIDGSILRMTPARTFVVEQRIGKGSEVESYFLAA